MMSRYLVAAIDPSGVGFIDPRVFAAGGLLDAAEQYAPTAGLRVAVWLLGEHPPTFIGSSSGTIHEGARL